MTNTERPPLTKLRQSDSKLNVEEIAKLIPYIRTLGMTLDQKGRELTFILPFSPDNVGNKMLPALHGGAIGAFLETAAIIELLWSVELTQYPKPVDINIDYLRSGRALDTFARAHVTKLGRRVANVRVEAWQEEISKPIAAMHGHFLISQADFQ